MTGLLHHVNLYFCQLSVDWHATSHQKDISIFVSGKSFYFISSLQPWLFMHDSNLFVFSCERILRKSWFKWQKHPPEYCSFRKLTEGFNWVFTWCYAWLCKQEVVCFFASRSSDKNYTAFTCMLRQFQASTAPLWLLGIHS